MIKKRGAISLTPLDDIFSVDSPLVDMIGQVIDAPLNQIHDFKDHPFQIRMNEEMADLIESVAQYGVLTPGIARPRKEGGYELISGHRRKYASLKAEKKTMPIIVREMDDDTAIILMVHSNKQREDVLPSERARSLKMMMEALNRQGQRTDLTSSEVRKKSTREWSIDEAVDKTGIKKSKIYDFIALNNLIPDLLEMVDDRKLGSTIGVNLSSLKRHEQSALYLWMVDCKQKPTLKQAEMLKERSKEGTLPVEDLPQLMVVPPPTPRPKKLELPMKKILSYFPPDTSLQTMQKTILKLLSQYQNGQAE